MISKLLKKKWVYVIVVILSICAFVGVRLLGLNYKSQDYNLYLSNWCNYISRHKGFLALKDSFSNYTPIYMYILVFITYLPISNLFAIKAVSIIFDFGCAITVGKIVNLKYQNKWVFLLGFLVVGLLPTSILNSSVWGQCDSVYTFFIVVSLYYIMKKKYDISLIMYGLAFSFKLQAILFAPFLFLFFINKKIKWYKSFIIPIVMGITIVPNLIVGKPILKVLKVYFGQVKNTSSFIGSAPSLEEFFQITTIQQLRIVNILLIGLTGVILILMCIFVCKRKPEFNYDNLAIFALTFFTVTTFLLPAMHERYFYIADILSLITAIYFKKEYIIIAVTIQTTSIIGYLEYFKNDFSYSQFVSILMAFVALILIYSIYVNINNNSKTQVRGEKTSGLSTNALRDEKSD